MTHTEKFYIKTSIRISLSHDFNFEGLTWINNQIDIDYLYQSMKESIAYSH